MRRQRGRHVVLCREHERSRPRERHVDPEAREPPPPLLEPLQGLLGPVELAECEQRLDLKRLAPVEQRFCHPHRVVRRSHLRECAIGRLGVTGGKLDEALDREQPFDPPRPRPLALCLCQQPQECRAGSLQPPAMRIDERAPAEGRRVRPSQVDGLEQSTASLRVLLREIPASRAELDHR